MELRTTHPRALAAIVFFLLAGGLIMPALSPTAAGFGERPHEGNQVISGTNNLVLSALQRVAQSFNASETYRLLNVTLRLRNLGDLTDSVNVAIQDDAADQPSGSNLASADVVVGGGVTNANVPFPTTPTLVGGARYWIVLTHGAALPTNGYEWHHSNADTYPWGVAKSNAGLGWGAPLAMDMYFMTYGRELEANLTVGIGPAVTEANADDLVTFTVRVDNTGTLAGSPVWVNETFSPGLSYDSDTAGSLGATSGYPSYRFPSLPNGPHSFTVTARVGLNLPPGTVLTNRVDMEYRDSTGAIRSGFTASANVIVGLVTKELYLGPGSSAPPAAQRLNPGPPTGGAGSQATYVLTRGGTSVDFAYDRQLARPFTVLGGSAVLFLDSASGTARDIDVNLTLSEWNGVTLVPFAYRQVRIRTNAFTDFERFTITFGAMDRTFPALYQVHLAVRAAATGTDDFRLATNSSFADSRLEARTSTYVAVDALSLEDANGPATAWSPRDSLVVVANVSDPLGSGEIATVWVNLTAPDGSPAVDQGAMALVAFDPSSPSAWGRYAFTYGPPLEDGTYGIEVVAVERNGVLDVESASATVRGPAFTLEKLASVASGNVGDRFTYTIWYNNTGSAPADRVWINDTLPTEVTFVSTSDPGAMTGSYNWTWTGVAPGPHRLDIVVDLLALPPAPYIRNLATVEFTDEKGYLWTVPAATADVIVSGPVLSLGKSASTTTVHRNESVVYTISYDNSGSASASHVWINDTLPADVAFVSSSALLDSFSGQTYRWHFTNVGVGPHSFTITVAVNVNAGSPQIVNWAFLNYTNPVDVPMPPRSASRLVTLLSPSIPTGTIALLPAFADPGDPVPVIVSYSNLGNELARDVWINLSMDPFLGFLNASASATVSGTDVRFVLAGVGTGPSRLYLNLSVALNVPDGRGMPVTGTIEYTDGAGNLRPTVPLDPDSVGATTPRVGLLVSPTNPTAEAGTQVTLTLDHRNTGNGVARDVWVNVTLPAQLVYLSDTAGGASSAVGSTYTWRFRDAAPGTAAFDLQLGVRPSAADGLGVDVGVLADYTDANGNWRNRTTANARVDFVAPSVTVNLTADAAEVRPGGTFTYTIRIRNGGSTVARTVWVLDSVDPRLEIVSYASRVPATGAPNLNWSLPDVQPGQEDVITITVRVSDGTPAGVAISNAAEVAFTNSVGTLLPGARSVPHTITVVMDLVPIVLGVGVTAALVAAVAVVLRRRMSPRIEEVFLASKDGLLIHHLSTSLKGRDEDVLAGMLAAVQTFVRDAFQYSEDRNLQRLDVGDYRVFIERGKVVFLAAASSRGSPDVIQKRLRTALEKIEASYGDLLSAWDGTIDKILGVRDLLGETLLGTRRLPRREGRGPGTGDT